MTSPATTSDTRTLMVVRKLLAQTLGVGHLVNTLVFFAMASAASIDAVATPAES